jgi:hypothetical protein
MSVIPATRAAILEGRGKLHNKGSARARKPPPPPGLRIALAEMLSPVEHSPTPTTSI